VSAVRSIAKWSVRGVLLVCGLALMVLGVVSAPNHRDLGDLRIVVLQSDDWGMEGWFPDSLAADGLSDLVTSLPPGLSAYAQSSLESAADVESLATLLQEFRGVSGLPAILQANTIVAGPDLGSRVAREGTVGWPLHPSGRGNGRYARPSLRGAVDSAIARGVWRPELHGLTHFDLFAYAAARRRGDRIERQARAEGTFAYTGWRTDTELGHPDPIRARTVATMATTLFRRRFGRPPVSIIAPDYRWNDYDEAAWRELGIRVVQAKREQIDPSWDLGSRKGRILKRLLSNWQRRRGRFVYLDRPARLEPYGSFDLDARQGAMAAARQVRQAWARGEPGVISVHRVQLASLDPDEARAGRAQLRACLRELGRDGGLRFLVDDEVAQLLRRGWSWSDRGDRRVIRNHTGQDLRLPSELGAPMRVLPPGCVVFPVPRESGESSLAAAPRDSL